MNAKYPPGPRDGLFGIKNFEPLRTDPIGFTTRIAEEYGDFAFVRVGWVRLYFVNRPELIREVLTTKGRSFRKLHRQMRAPCVRSKGKVWSFRTASRGRGTDRLFKAVFTPGT